jgi:heme-degrading monooxygenase HmoA
MRNWRLWLGSCGMLVSMAAILAISVSAASPPEKVLRHIVLYKFKDDLKPGQVDEVIAAFNLLASKVDTVIGYEHGTNLSTEGKSDGLTHAFVVTFRNEKDRDAYIAHPAHAEYVKVVKDRREKVVVFDFWAPEGS